METTETETEHETCRQLLADELSLLKSMYSKQELILPEGDLSIYTERDVQLLFHLDINGMPVEVVVQCGNQYPLYMKPTVMVRCNDVNCVSLNNELRKFVEESELGEPITVNIIQWVQENLYRFTVKKDPHVDSKEDSSPGEEQIWARFWIYSHHLRSPIKRRNIDAIAKRLNLNGISLPGKPGIIIVEGTKRDCREFWENIRGWTWKRITVRHQEESTEQNGFLRMSKFKELSSLDGKFDLGQLKKLLADIGLEYGFPILLNMQT